jgi:hypothetical protein
MSVLLLGRWDYGGNLVIEESYDVEDGDQETIDALVESQDNEDGNAWACEFLVDEHSRAIQEAYVTYVAHEGTRLIDEVQGIESQE